MKEQNSLKEVCIITGASRGLGRALSLNLARQNCLAFLIARREMTSLVKEIEAKGGKAKAFRFNLAESNDLEQLMNDIFKQIDFENIKSITLINNAATLSPIAFSGNYQSQAAIDNLKVNCIAPIILSSVFIQQTKDFKGEKIIINISSVASKASFEGWSLYCSGKAALEMFSQTSGREQERLESGVKIYTIDPGALDTDMQYEVIKKDEKDFPAVAGFRQLCASGSLKNPNIAAQDIISFVEAKWKT